MLRREFLSSLMALAASPALAAGHGEPGLQLGEASPFSATDVVDLARARGAMPYQPPRAVPSAWIQISYED